MTGRELGRLESAHCAALSTPGTVDHDMLLDMSQPPEELLGELSGGLAAQATYGRMLMAQGECNAMVLPEWMADDALIMSANERFVSLLKVPSL